MKRGELQHDGCVSFLTDRVVMAPKQHRVILVGDDRARNVYNITFSGQIYTVNIDVVGGWRSNGCGAGIWNEV